MKTTLDIPENLLREAMRVTGILTKTGVIREALVGLIQREKLKSIKKYRGKIKLGIDLDSIRKR